MGEKGGGCSHILLATLEWDVHVKPKWLQISKDTEYIKSIE